MKKTQKVTRVKLDIDQVNDYVLFGLVAAEPDYKLSLSLNKKFKISLKNVSPIKLPGDDLAFSRFSNINESKNLVFNLVSNRSGKNYLLSKLKNIDYLLQVMVSENEFDLNDTTTLLRETEAVNAVFNIDVKSIKDKNLLYLNQ
jgi:hypothetical protein